MSLKVHANPAVWRKVMMGLLLAQEKGELPVPIAMWFVPPLDESVHVQVEDRDYRAWLDAIHAPVVESRPHEGQVHVSATGELVNCRMVTVRVVAVMENPAAREVAP
jgi:hypothetical protein